MTPRPANDSVFKFKRFDISYRKSAMKIGTDGVLLGGWSRIPEGNCLILDVGAGTGLISLMAAQRNPSARIIAIEIDPDAADEAEENRISSPFASKIRIINADFLKWDTELKFDLIISNPPFFNESLKSPEFQRAQARHETYLPLEPFLKKSSGLLADTGSLAMIYPSSRDKDVTFAATMQGFQERYKCHVSTVSHKQPSRTLWQFSKSSASYTYETLTIKENDGYYSKKYKDLLKDFYINF